MKKKTLFAILVVAVLALSISTLPQLTRAQKNGDGGGGSPIAYPETKKGDVVEDYFGTKVPDPYRWLEDDRAPEVAAWVEAENKVTFAYLEKISYRTQLKDRLTKLLNYPKYSAPTRRGENYV